MKRNVEKDFVVSNIMQNYVWSLTCHSQKIAKKKDFHLIFKIIMIFHARDDFCWISFDKECFLKHGKLKFFNFLYERANYIT